MAIKLFIITALLASGCGKDVKIDNSKLESFSEITQADSAKSIQDGVLKRTSSSVKLTAGGKSYDISKYSSKLAFDFISLQPIGDTPVKFKGAIKTTEIVIERIEGK